jgi:hypothetical protein
MIACALWRITRIQKTIFGGNAMAQEFAECGWIVEVVLTAPDDQPDARFFAVGTEQATEAEYATLRYPGILSTDKRIAKRRLSAKEIAALGLKARAVRPLLDAGFASTTRMG